MMLWVNHIDNEEHAYAETAILLSYQSLISAKGDGAVSPLGLIHPPHLKSNHNSRKSSTIRVRA